ncbi:MAG TPA: RNA methyltransferase [Tepidisphaeraceae bacterium]|jgi:tRNA G18 (ribose-2'-O)-methylase SpoU|nr:RNA methyltransferase [Tepidisphaeraceae bacterium]
MSREIIQVHSIDDPRLAPYRALKERDLAREGGRFIAEGEQVVRRLFASNFKAESVLLSERRVEEIAPIVPEDVIVYVASDAVIEKILGFRFHSGVMAVGLRGRTKTLDDVLPKEAEKLRLVICPDTANTENLGGMIRIAAAFGADAMILGPQCCDPFFRQSVRVSMGTAFRLPLIQSADLSRDLGRLRDEWNVELIATVLDESAEMLVTAKISDRWALLFGNEAQGLSKEVVEWCDRRITIPMKLGTDSLNVMVAAGVFLYHFSQQG